MKVLNRTHKAPRKQLGGKVFWVRIPTSQHIAEMALNVFCIAFFLYVAMQFVLTIPTAL